MPHPEAPLTNEQRAAVENYLDGALLLATVGAGKTRVLAAFERDFQPFHPGD